MRDRRSLTVWACLGALGAVAMVWGYPRFFPLAPESWQVNKGEATAIALERFGDLGEPIADPYLVTSFDWNATIERRLQLALGQLDAATLRATPLGRHVTHWRVVAYEPGANPSRWTYRADLSLAGELLALRLRLTPEAPGGRIDPAAARLRSDSFLAEQGFDLAQLREPEVRTEQLRARTDTTFRYLYREQPLGEALAYGIEVRFGGERLTGFDFSFEDPDRERLQGDFQPIVLREQVNFIAVFVLLPVIGVLFVRRYHAGEVGVKRGGQIMVFVGAAALVLVVLAARSATEGSNWGPMSRQQTTYLWAAQLLALFFLPTALLCLLAWSVGESLCREQWGTKLAAFDALVRRDWTNATVARSALRGTAAGLVLSGALVVAGVVLGKLHGVWPVYSFSFGPWWPSATWPGVALLAFCLVFVPYAELVGRLLFVPLFAGRLGRVGGSAVAAVVGGLVLWGSGLPLFQLGWSLLVSLLVAGALVAIFVAWDLLATLIAGFLGLAAQPALTLLFADDTALQLQGALPLLAALLPLLLSVRYLGSDREFEYRYDDIPPHVRRIAERERQRVELETARGIQSSILPELPPRLQGVDIAHAYLPASEVGGDFYDVLALEDGRLAVAVGDVAGHGVSSGLVMSMAKSALAVQVTFNPEVAAVFETLNRMVYQTARKRLLATLCYAVLDPLREELVYASAGHLYPYVVAAGGKVHTLESTSYPLGVRGRLAIEVRTAKVRRGDTLFLCSDGIVEARAEGSSEMFGFERLEESLSRHHAKDVERLCDAVLADVQRFARHAPREDDQTLLVLRIPAA